MSKVAKKSTVRSTPVAAFIQRFTQYTPQYFSYLFGDGEWVSVSSSATFSTISGAKTAIKKHREKFPSPTDRKFRIVRETRSTEIYEVSA
jgi:hypothetical protein